VQRKRLRTGWLVFLALLIAGVVAFAASDTVRFVVVGLAGILLYGNHTEQDVKQAEAISNAILSVHHFAHNSISQPSRPPVSWTAASRGLLTQPAMFQVYDVRDKAEQDNVISAIRALLVEPHSKPVEVQFLDHENWIVQGNSGERGPETQLRRVLITASRIQDEAGTKVVKYPSP
jgi:hypothetical protein